MPRTVLLVGTRKGLFMLESDADRRDWKMRGPFCEGWPVYHAVHDAASGAIYAAAASEWHGAGRLAERRPRRDVGALERGPRLRRRRRQKLSKVSSLTAAHGRVLVGRRGGRASSRAATAARPGRC